MASEAVEMNKEVRKKALTINLHRFMAKKRINQSDLSRRTGISQPTISRVLSGKGIPNVLVMAQIADVLGVNGQKVCVDDLIAPLTSDLFINQDS